MSKAAGYNQRVPEMFQYERWREFKKKLNGSPKNTHTATGLGHLLTYDIHSESHGLPRIVGSIFVYTYEPWRGPVLLFTALILLLETSLVRRAAIR